MVVAYHFVAYDRGTVKPWGMAAPQAFPVLHGPASYGWLGVELFFVISGFVICMSAWGRTLGGFARSRIVRLYPAYWVAIVLTTVVLTLWPRVRQPVGLSDTLLNLTMLQEPLGARSVDAVYWTLWAEARFYLLFAIVVWRGLTYRRALMFCYGWLLAAAIAAGADQPLLTLVLQPAYAPYFVAGVGYFLIHRFGSNLAVWAVVAVSLLMAQAQVIIAFRHVTRDVLHRSLPVAPALLVVVAIFAVMAAVALGLLSWIRWRWLTVAGILTYPLYLLHEYIGWTMIAALHSLMPRHVTLAVVIAVMLIGAWLVHRLFERPLARLLNRHLQRPLPGSGPGLAPGQRAGGPGLAPVQELPGGPVPASVRLPGGPGAGAV